MYLMGELFRLAPQAEQLGTFKVHTIFSLKIFFATLAKAFG
jgi:hypothetical protein